MFKNLITTPEFEDFLHINIKNFYQECKGSAETYNINLMSQEYACDMTTKGKTKIWNWHLNV